jgi:peptidoglycan hydrolase-like protein with peptidoglycan-binding domain
MKKITQNSVYGSKLIGVFTVLTILVSTGLIAQAYAYNPISSQLDFGSRGYDVTNLQTFFADNSSIYPEGLITGYFGGLTKASVLKFQAQYGLDQAGRVGPVTLAKINSIIASGGWVAHDVAGPSFYNVTESNTNTSATFNLNTDEKTSVRVAYNPSPLMFNEGDINSNGFGPIGGYYVYSNNGTGTAHTITLPNLQPNTTYYYTIIATDTTGNMSVVGPNNTFRTNQ